MSKPFEIVGAKQLGEKLIKLSSDTRKKFKLALRRRAEYVMFKSKKQLVPVNKQEGYGGNLRDTGGVSPVEETKTGLEVTLFFGGPAAPYALAVHENPSEHDPPSWQGKTIVFHPPGHGQKFLEKPVNEQAKTLSRDLKADVGMMK